jgi:8-oxo-dGTP diphosphatase
VREVREETGLIVDESDAIGERTHPNTGRKIVYVACRVVSGEARVVDDDELDNLAWVQRNALAQYVPYGFYAPVQEYLDSVLQNDD